MSWLTNSFFVTKGKEIIWGFLYDLASDIASTAFELFTNFLINDTDLNKFFDINILVTYFQIIAGGLLIVFVAWEAFKQLSGGMIPTEEKSIGTLILQTVWAGFLIFFLPWSVTNIFLRLNNYLIKLIQSIGIRIVPNQSFNILLEPGLTTLGTTLILMMVILFVAFLILGIIAGIRYAELAIVTLVAPLVAVSAVNQGEAISVWVRETVSIVFTQVVHVILLQLLISSLGRMGVFFNYVISLGIVVVMLRGPKVIRTFIYSTGTGSATVAAVGAAGRMAAFKYMVSASMPAK